MKRLLGCLILTASSACSNIDAGQVNDVIQAVGQSTGQMGAPTQAESVSATKQALDKGVQAGVGLLQKEGGFSNSIYKILVPEQLQRTTEFARKVGFSSYVDQFEKSLNRAAEQAVGTAGPIFKNAITQLTFQDIVTILTGPKDAATQYFRVKASDQLQTAFLPIVKRATSENQVTSFYKQITTSIAPAAAVAGIPIATVDLETYVTDKAVEALFSEIAVQEAKIRENPVERTTALLQKVFSFYSARQAS